VTGFDARRGYEAGEGLINPAIRSIRSIRSLRTVFFDRFLARTA
jgi:hypothetical protein